MLGKTSIAFPRSVSKFYLNWPPQVSKLYTAMQHDQTTRESPLASKYSEVCAYACICIHTHAA